MAAGQDETRTAFETEMKEELELQRLQGMITGGVTVSDAAVREAYLQQGTKVKFDYAVVSLNDIKKSIDPSEGDLQAFFKQNAARYANAIPETPPSSITATSPPAPFAVSMAASPSRPCSP
jgi:peptidyl-prolyl cis-trans isomerase D